MSSVAECNDADLILVFAQVYALHERLYNLLGCTRGRCGVLYEEDDIDHCTVRVVCKIKASLLFILVGKEKKNNNLAEK
jgi:hypothetical protein